MIVTISSDPKFTLAIQDQLNPLGNQDFINFNTIDDILNHVSFSTPELILLDSQWIKTGEIQFNQIRQRIPKIPVIVVKNPTSQYPESGLVSDLMPVALPNLKEVVFYTLLAIRTASKGNLREPVQPPLEPGPAYNALGQIKNQPESTTVKDTPLLENYLAKLSHELRAPLAAIRNLSELLSATNLTPTQSDHLNSIKYSADRLLALLNDILDYSRLEASKLELKVKEFNLLRIIESSLNLVAIPAAQKNLDLAYRIDEDVPETIIGDPNRLAQVLINLLTNAIKFTDSGAVSLEVQLGASSLPQAAMVDSEIELIFTIRDTGIGIPLQAQSLLFKPFSQLDHKKPETEFGSGLGLAICKQLVRLMGGMIWVESSGIAGKGSAFSFTIQAKVVHSPLSPYLQKNHPHLLGKHIVVIGKQRLSLVRLIDWLVYWGFMVSHNETPAQWSNALHEPLDVDLVLIDDREIQPAEAKQLADRLSELKQLRFLPVLVISDPNTRLRDYFKPILNHSLLWPLSVPRLFRGLTDGLQFTIATTRPQIYKPKMNILLVDDDIINLNAVQMLLERIGYQADTAQNGLDALEVLARKKYDLVIMDMRMGVMDGHATTRNIRETLPPEKQPVIAILTAGVTQNQLNALQSAGIDAYLEKPVSINHLINLIEMAQYFDQPAMALPPFPEPNARHTDLAKTKKSGINPHTLLNLLNFSRSDSQEPQSDIFELFIQSTQKQMELVLKSNQELEVKKLQDALHALRGSAQVYGAERLAFLCRNLERDLQEKSVDDLSHRLAEIQEEFDLVRVALQSYLDNPQILNYLTNQSGNLF